MISSLVLPSRLANHEPSSLDSSSSSQMFSTQSNRDGGLVAIVMDGEEFTTVAFSIRHVGRIGALSLGDSNRETDEEEDVAMATWDTPTTSSSQIGRASCRERV